MPKPLPSFTPVRTLAIACRYLSAFALVLALSAVPARAQTTFAGNGSGGFGGPLGGGTLTVSDNTSSGLISFNLATGNSGASINDIAFYFSPTGTGGVSDTSSITDTGDEGRIAISGNSAVTGRSLVQFASGFSAQYAVAIDNNGNANLFQIVPGQSYLTYISGATDTQSAGHYGFSINASQLGLTAGSGASFSFVATLSNANADNGNPSGAFYRSNETIGASNVDNNAQGNLGNTGTLTYSGFDTYTLGVPEPSTYLGGAGIVISGLMAFRRSRKSCVA